MSYQPRIDPKSRKAARFISRLQGKIQAALVASGKTQQEVAGILGVDRSVVNRRLKGNANLTARSIAEFAHALDKDITIEFVDKKKAVRVNSQTTTTQNIDVHQRTHANPSGTIDPSTVINLVRTTS